MSLKLGDLVKLKSGGPVMTLGKPKPGGLFTCYWFVSADPHEAVYPLDVLEPAAKSGKGRDDEGTW